MEERLKNNVIFIGGIERSGTSLLRSIIGSHPDVAIFQYDLPLWTKFYPINKRKIISCKRKIYLLEEILTHPKFIKSEVSFNKDYFVGQIQHSQFDTISDIFHLLLKSYSKKLNRKRYGLKTPYNEFYFDDIIKEFPQSKFVHLIRNPMDVACSYKKASQIWAKKKSIYSQIYYWEKSVQKGLIHSKNYQSSYMMIKYEDIVLDTYNMIKNVCEFLNLPYDKKMLSMNNHLGWEGHNSSFVSKNNGNARIFSNSISRYETTLTKKEVSIFKQLLYNYLIELNYIDKSELKLKRRCINSIYSFYKVYNKVKDILLLLIQRSIFYPSLKKLYYNSIKK